MLNLGCSRLIKMSRVQSGRSWLKVDGSKDLKWMVFENGRYKRLKIDDWWTKLSGLKGWEWMVQKPHNERLKRNFKVDGLWKWAVRKEKSSRPIKIQVQFNSSSSCRNQFEGFIPNGAVYGQSVRSMRVQLDGHNWTVKTGRSKLGGGGLKTKRSELDSQLNSQRGETWTVYRDVKFDTSISSARRIWMTVYFYPWPGVLNTTWSY